MTNPDWAERLQRTRKREYDKGVEDERSRITKLLEPFIHKAAMHEITINDCRSLIALIKGEQE